MQGIELVPLRARTDALVARKRQVDRAKHRSNRAEGKLRLERIEQDISHLRCAMGEVLLSLQSFQEQQNTQKLSAYLAGAEEDHVCLTNMEHSFGAANTEVSLPITVFAAGYQASWDTKTVFSVIFYL